MPKFHKQDLLSKDNPQNNSHEYNLEEDFLREPVKVLLEWKGPARPYRKKDVSFYRTVAIIIILISMILLLAGQFLLIGVLLAFGFLVYVLNFTAPEEVTYKISTQGITVGDHFYHWYDLDSFWFTERENHKILNVLTHYRFPGMLMLLLDNNDTNNIRNIVARYLPFLEIAPKTIMDKWSESLRKMFPLEAPKKS